MQGEVFEIGRGEFGFGFEVLCHVPSFTELEDDVVVLVVFKCCTETDYMGRIVELFVDLDLVLYPGFDFKLELGVGGRLGDNFEGLG